MVTRLELAKSNKFFEVEVVGTVVIVRWGRIGATGRRNRNGYHGAVSAKANARKLVAEWIAKGFVVVTRGSLLAARRR